MSSIYKKLYIRVASWVTEQATACRVSLVLSLPCRNEFFATSAQKIHISRHQSFLILSACLVSLCFPKYFAQDGSNFNSKT